MRRNGGGNGDEQRALLEALLGLCNGQSGAPSKGGDDDTDESTATKDPTPLFKVVGKWKRPHVRQDALVDKLRRCIDSNPDMDVSAICPTKKMTCLHLLVASRFNRAARFLVERGADPLVPDGDGETPLMLAVRGCRGTEAHTTLAFLDWLLGYMRAQPARWGTTLDVMLNERVVLDNADTMSMLQVAISMEGDSDALVQILLEHGASPDGRPCNGYMPMHSSVAKTKCGVTALLLSYGARVDCVASNDGSTPLLLAALGGDSDMVALLLRHGADPAKRMGSMVSSSGGDPAWCDKNACDLAHMRGHHLMADVLRTWDVETRAQRPILSP